MTEKYALDETNTLASKLSPVVDLCDANTQYLCSMFSELAYHHVLEYELDKRKRIKLIPSDAFRKITRAGIPTTALKALQDLDIPVQFTLIGSGAIAVCVIFNDLLIVACRGTIFSSFYDWRVNLQAAMVSDVRPVWHSDIPYPFLFGVYGLGKLHGGFQSESAQLIPQLQNELDLPKCANVKRILFTGHSLGGAIAALMESNFREYETSLCIFGAPRVADNLGIDYLYKGKISKTHLHIRRVCDMVPTVPPRAFGYADYPNAVYVESSINIIGNTKEKKPKSKATWRRFIRSGFDDHKIDIYRTLLGEKSDAKYFECNLTSYRKLTSMDV